MTTPKKILIVDDEIDICALLKRFLERNDFVVDTAYRGSDAMTLINKKKYDLVISDFRLPDTEGIDLLKKIKAISRDIAVIIITGYSDIRMAVEVIKYGAYDYVTKPLYPEELLATINEALAHKDNTDRQPAKSKSTAASKKAPKKAEYLIGESDSAKSLYKNMEIVAPTTMSVLINGETGTGKEFVAQEIHRLSDRSEGPFVAIDSGALPKDIAGSEFFGHEKGAFTGAVQERDGKFKQADGGTLFLDEIGNLTYEIQLKLLRVLQERKFTRLGGSKDISIDVRIIAATNENLKHMVADGQFREDLYYRLNEFSLVLSPLRNRYGDFEKFIDLFIAQANEQLGRDVTHISKEVMEKFKKYAWPGNLRELKNVIKRGVLLAKDSTIELSAIPDEIKYGLVPTEAPASDSLKSVANHAERNRILSVLSQTGNNKSKAAKILDIDRKTLYNKLKLFDIEE